jgi:hypothetical protein
MSGNAGFVTALVTTGADVTTGAEVTTVDDSWTTAEDSDTTTCS